MITFVLFTLMIACIPWMLIVSNYHYYYRLTVQSLVDTTLDTYLLDGLIAYAKAYYRAYQDTLSLPLKKEVFYKPAGKEAVSFIVLEATKEGITIEVHITKKEKVIRKKALMVELS